VRRPGFDAAVLRLDGHRGIAVSLQGPPPGERDPYAAGVAAVLGAARNVACAGGEPIGLTDCLNFGNPEKAEIGWELARAIDGVADAARAIGAPVVSGNVSLYNETDGRAIPPTPVVGCVGLVRDVRSVPGRWREGDGVYALTAESLDEEAELIRWLWEHAAELTLAHDVGRGGPEAAFDEAALWSGIGLRLEADLPPATRAIVASTGQATPWYLGTVGGR
jgi:phosphoribosylformylglycinamidine (FGAM) synthase-like enzyme